MNFSSSKAFFKVLLKFLIVFSVFSLKIFPFFALKLTLTGHEGSSKLYIYTQSFGISFFITVSFNIAWTIVCFPKP
jgi:hypothetical protein